MDDILKDKIISNHMDYSIHTNLVLKITQIAPKQWQKFSIIENHGADRVHMQEPPKL